MCKHPFFVAITVTVAAIALTFAATPAIADSAPIPSPIGGTVALSVPNITLTGGCEDVAFQFKIAPSSPVDSWDADVSYAGPSSWPDADYLYGDSTGTFTGTFSICPGSDEPGSYRASADVEIYDADFNETDVTVTDAFTITMATTSLRAWRSGTTLTGEFRENGKLSSGTVIELQKRSGKTWSYVNEKNSGLNGRVAFSVARQYGVPFRLLFAGDDGRKASTSTTVTTPRASSTLRAHRTKAAHKAWKINAVLGGPLKAGKRVTLQRRHGAKWRSTGKSCVTRSTGKCAIVFKQTRTKLNRTWYRASFAGTTAKAGKASTRFHLTKR